MKATTQIWIVGYQAGFAVVKQNLSVTGLHNIPRELKEFLDRYEAAKIGTAKEITLGHRYSPKRGKSLERVPKEAFQDLNTLQAFLRRKT